MAKITLRFNEGGSIRVTLSDTDAVGRRTVVSALAADLSDLARAVMSLFGSPAP